MTAGARRDVAALMSEMTVEEKASLTAGEDMWSLAGVGRLGVPKVWVTDGPSGARGPFLPWAGDATSACVPCGSALGATWDGELVERIGAMLGEEARTKGCSVLLAPTINLPRSPLAGRTFETFSEDPLLCGRTAAAFVRGVQSRGVATTPKHFVANDAEFERMTMSSVVDERSLREIYLVPFELAVREGGALGMMTGYNRLNGVYCSEHEELLTGILRGEWGFDGFVLTDWWGVASTLGSARAGLDLEMPGPGRAFGPALAAAVRDGELPEAELDAKVQRIVSVLDRVGALDAGASHEIRSVDDPEHRALAREAAAASMVLLRNEGVLPWSLPTLRSLAVIGPNADPGVIMGGGSASLEPHYRLSPLQALRARLGGTVRIVHERGVDISKTAPPLTAAVLRTPGGDPGVDVEVFAGATPGDRPLSRHTARGFELIFVGSPAGPTEPFSLRARAVFTPTETGTHRLTLVQLGAARLFVDGALAIDGVTDPPPNGPAYFGLGSLEMTAAVELRASEPVELVLEYTGDASPGLQGATVGCRLPDHPDMVGRAVAAAAAADAAVVVVGTNAEWESEGFDRASMDLPGDQDELVARVVEANPNTVVVVNAGSPVAMPWAGEARCVLQTWFGGQEMANALVDVLFGDADPGGRLPTTFPARVEHTPAYGNFPGENDEIRYGEGLLVGYRWYDARHLAPLYPFGHGLSYTSFEIGPPRLSSAELAPGEHLTVEVPVKNTGTRRGSEVVQCYVAPPPSTALFRPPRELKAFAKVHLDPGEQSTVTLALDGRAFAYWDPKSPDREAVRARLAFPFPFEQDGAPGAPPGWRVDAGEYRLHVGRSSADLAHVVPVVVRPKE